MGGKRIICPFCKKELGAQHSCSHFFTYHEKEMVLFDCSGTSNLSSLSPDQPNWPLVWNFPQNQKYRICLGCNIAYSKVGNDSFHPKHREKHLERVKYLWAKYNNLPLPLSKEEMKEEVFKALLFKELFTKPLSAAELEKELENLKVKNYTVEDLLSAYRRIYPQEEVKIELEKKPVVKGQDESKMNKIYNNPLELPVIGKTRR